MDGQRVWSFGTTDAAPSVTTVEWPKRLRRRLEGTADVRIVSGGDELFSGTVRFGNGEGRPQFVDNHGIPIFIDKWGLIQRPFDGRREAGVVDAMVDMARRVLQIMRDDCRIEGWLSFGTLLGAARDGRGDRPRLRHRPQLPQREADPGRDGRRALGHRPRPARAGLKRAAPIGELRDRAVQGARRRPGQPRRLHLLLRRGPAARDRDRPRGRTARGGAAAAGAAVRGPPAARARPTPTCSWPSPTVPGGGSPTRRSGTCPAPTSRSGSTAGSAR